MFQESELVNLALAVVAVVLLLPLVRREEFRDFFLLFLAFFLLVAALIATVVEGVVLPGFFNTLEHGCYAASGLTFALALRKMTAAPPEGEPGP